MSCMSHFANMMRRFDDCLKESRRRRDARVHVSYADLSELLLRFRRMDAQDRLHYPEHVKMLADAAQKALPHLQGAYAADVMRALGFARPNWRDEPV